MTSTKKPPGIIEFPVQKHAIPRPEPDTQRLNVQEPPTIEQIIDQRLKLALYHLMRAGEEINIQVMSYDEFEAFWQRVMEDER